ncbi:MAG: EAL domain-containing protein [Christensenellaceae bacterium]|nr:EAL domain-containing protein [Christensenellaceae bacterium]
MLFIGDYFALGLVIILFMFFFDSKVSVHYMPVSSKLFVGCLSTTALTAITDLLAGLMLEKGCTDYRLNMFVNSFYFVINIVTTSLVALYLFTKILEHTHERHCMRRACIGLAVLFGIYAAVVAANLWTGWLFSFTPDGAYVRGPINALGGGITMAQMVLVIICYAKNRAMANRPMRRALMQIFPVIPLYIIIQRIFPDVMLNSFILALAETVLFMTFQGQRQGVHTLTELNDRHRFFTELDQRIDQSEPFCVFLINIKNYGAINQRYGHKFGDEALYQFAFALEKLLPASLCFHMNGTVFAVVQRYTYPDLAEEQTAKLLEFMENGIDCMNTHVAFDHIAARYISSGHEVGAAEVFETMEYSVQQAHGLKHRYIACGDADSKKVARRRYLQQRLQVVDRDHGFEVWLQPTKCLSTGQFCSAEALIRLREQDGSLVSPAEFIPLAEQLGYISPITWFVLEEVCRMMAELPELKNVSVSINMPMPQLLEKGMLDRFLDIVDGAGIDHSRICIEFTERAILENFEQTKSIMESMAALGFRFYLDDFGTGYSNFNCLLQLPFAVIKLDTCLVHAGDYTMVNTLTRLFHEMGLTVIAEGAETEDEVRRLAEQGVDRVQGFALARPMSEDKLREFYAENPALPR